jgi:hypothetical protein
MMRDSTYHLYNNISWENCQRLATLNTQKNLTCVLPCVVRESDAANTSGPGLLS